MRSKSVPVFGGVLWNCEGKSCSGTLIILPKMTENRAQRAMKTGKVGGFTLHRDSKKHKRRAKLA